MPQKFSNKARSQLLAAITTTDTSFSVVATEADLFPTADVGTGALPSAPGNWFKAVIEDSNGYEIVYVRTRSAGSNVFSNVLRGQEGTTARSFPVGAIVGLRVTAQDAETAAKVPDLQAQITGLANSKLDVNAPSFSGNAATATKLQTPRTITIGNTGKAFDGSANVSWSLADIGAPSTGGTGATGTWDISVSGNAATATKLQTPRTITIGNTGKAFDGSADVSWSLADIGVTAATETASGIVELATTAEAQALASAVVALTPARLADAFMGANQSLSINGYQKLPGGLIIQWGTTPTIPTDASMNITFPITFPSFCASVVAQQTYGVGGNGVALSGWSISRKSSTGFTMNNDHQSQVFYWIAIGY